MSEFLTYLSVAASLGVLIFGIIKFSATKKETNKLEFIKQVNTFENELIELGKESPKAPNYYTHFRLNQFHKMYVLNRIAYLYSKNLIDEDFVDYFQFRFEIGYRAYDWVHKMEPQNSESELRYFLQLKEHFPKYNGNTSETRIQKYYSGCKQFCPNYHPKEDTNDPRTTKYPENKSECPENLLN